MPTHRYLQLMSD